MKPQKNIVVERTQNDTDTLKFICKYVGENGTVLVDDGDTVTLHIATSPVTSIIGAAKGDGSGTFYFSPGAFAAETGTFNFEIEVNDGTSIMTIGEGKIKQRPEIG